MPSWPATLPPDAFLGLTDQRQDAVARNQMDAGPPSRRARFTAATRNVEVPIVLDGEQRATFDEFFRVTLIEGSLSFTWEDPVDDSTVEFAFKSPPQWSLTKGHADPARRTWRASLQLEIQP